MSQHRAPRVTVNGRRQKLVRPRRPSAVKRASQAPIVQAAGSAIVLACDGELYAAARG